MGFVEHRGIGRFKRARMQPRGQVSQNFEFKILIVECENGQRKIRDHPCTDPIKSQWIFGRF